MKRIFFYILPIVAALLSLAACSDDDYDSVPPTFSAMTFENLSGASDDLRVGDRIVATAVQRKKGERLYGSSYSWSVEPAEGVATQRAYGGGVYDDDPRNPSDTIVFASAGSYKITLTAEYKPSGARGLESGYTETLESGGTATYNVLGSGLFYYTATVTGYVRVGN